MLREIFELIAILGLCWVVWHNRRLISLHTKCIELLTEGIDALNKRNK